MGLHFCNLLAFVVTDGSCGNTNKKLTTYLFSMKTNGFFFSLTAQ